MHGPTTGRCKDAAPGKAMRTWTGPVLGLLLLVLVPGAATAQNSAPSAAPLAMPAMVGPLSTASPTAIDAGPFGKLQVTGILSGMGQVQDNHAPDDHEQSADVSNGQVFLQKTSGLVQYYLQAGAYNIPVLGAPLLSTRKTVDDFFGPLPVAYLKIAPKGDFSVLMGKLPTLIGVEDTFTFENMDLERGLLWGQENAVNRGIQVNYVKGKLSSSLAWNDGFYSDRFNWLTGMLTYAMNAANSVMFMGGGNYGTTPYSSTATPMYQNNSSIYVVGYTHTAKAWTFAPYLQYSRVPENTRLGVQRATATLGGAAEGYYTFGPHISLAGRAEYIGSSGNTRDGAVNLLYGVGSKAWSLTATPTYQDKAFFSRAEFSIVHLMDGTQGDEFGKTGTHADQARGMIEAGFMF